MSKRNKKARSTRSSFMLETLEQRQLLATIVGGTGGTEVAGGSDVLVNGKIYDQILMTGSTISVKADAGQIVRVDFLDASNDLVRAEFAGTGTMTVTLANFVAAAVPTTYTTTTAYVKGLATVSIDGSASDTNVLITSLGPVTAFNGLSNPIFGNGTTLGGNNLADVAAIIIRADPSSPVGNNFGSIFAGNAVFGNITGAVGIIAPNIQFKGVINIGDIKVAGSATGILQIGAFSDTKTVTVAGGDLKAVAGATGGAIINQGVTKIVSQSNFSSKSVTTTDAITTKIIDVATVNAIFTNSAGNTVSQGITYSSSVAPLSIDGSTVTQATLDTYKGLFLNDVTITNGLASGLVFRAFQFGNISITGNLAGLITTDANDNNSASALAVDASEQAIGNVTITGDIVNGGGIESSTTIGNISVSGKVTQTVAVAGASGVITTLGRTIGDASIGNVTLTGDLSVVAAEGLINAGLTGGVNANIGAIVFSGAVTATSTGAPVGIISAGTLVSGANSAVGAIGSVAFAKKATLTNNYAGSAQFGNLINASKAIGAISAGDTLTFVSTGSPNGINGDSIASLKVTNNDLVITSGKVNATTSIGDISSNKLFTNTAGGITAGTTIGNIVSGTNYSGAGVITAGTNIGNITVTKGSFNNGGVISATAGSIGNIIFTEGNATIGAAITAKTSIGNITASKGTLTVTAAVTAKNIGDITVAAQTSGTATDLTFTGTGAFLGTDAAATDIWTGTSIGNVSVGGGKIVGSNSGTVIEFQANKIGNVSVVGDSTTVSLLKDVVFSAKGTTQATLKTASIGNITLDGSTNVSSTGVIATSTAGAYAVDAFRGNGFSSSGNLGNITIVEATAGKLLADVTDASLVFRAGSSELGSATSATAATAIAAGNSVKTGVASTTVDSVTIGDITITASFTAPVSSASTTQAGVGFAIVAGGQTDAVGTAGSFANLNAAAANVTVGALVTSGVAGNLIINDISGGITRSSFANSTITGSTAAQKGISAIIADSFKSITVNTAQQSVINTTGFGQKGVLSTVGVSAASQGFTGGDTTNLVIVVL